MKPLYRMAMLVLVLGVTGCNHLNLRNCDSRSLDSGTRDECLKQARAERPESGARVRDR